LIPPTPLNKAALTNFNTYLLSALLNPLGTPRIVINQSMYHAPEQGNLSRIGNENK